MDQKLKLQDKMKKAVENMPECVSYTDYFKQNLPFFPPSFTQKLDSLLDKINKNTNPLK